MRQTALPRQLPDCVGQVDDAGGRGVFAPVPGVRRRHPAHLVHHGAGANPEDSSTPWRTARAAAALSRSQAADRLGRARSGPQRMRRDSDVARRAARDRHPQPLKAFHATVRTAREKRSF